HFAVEADVRAVGDLDVAVLARQDRVAADEDAASDRNPAVAVPLRVDEAVVVDHDVVADADLVRVPEHDVLAEDHVAPAGAEQQREERPSQREPERAGHVLRRELHALVAEKRAPARKADDQRRIFFARGLAAGEQLVLRLGNVGQNGLYDKPRMPRWITPLLIAALVVARSAVFVLWPQAHFDADQAVTGLMAKHLSELRAFPVFWYGQTYMLGVEAWLAAPLFALFGASGTALKLPLLAMNVAIALLLYLGFTRDAGLSDSKAAVATLFFVLASPITSAHFLTANGGNVEPTVYILLLWFLRRRPLWMGLTLG